jgi:hypothetical protein
MACKTSVAFNILTDIYVIFPSSFTGTSDPSVWYYMGPEFITNSTRRTNIAKLVVSGSTIEKVGAEIDTVITVASNLNTNLRSFAAIPGNPIDGFWVYETKGNSPTVGRIHTLDADGTVLSVVTVQATTTSASRMSYNPYLGLLMIMNRISGSLSAFYYDPTDLSLVDTSSSVGTFSSNALPTHTSDGATWIGGENCVVRYTRTSADVFDYSGIVPGALFLEPAYIEANCDGSSLNVTIIDDVNQTYKYTVSSTGSFTASPCNLPGNESPGLLSSAFTSYDGTRQLYAGWDSTGIPVSIDSCGNIRYLRQLQRDDRRNSPRKWGLNNNPTSRQHSLRKAPGTNTYLKDDLLVDCGC